MALTHSQLLDGTMPNGQLCVPRQESQIRLTRVAVQERGWSAAHSLRLVGKSTDSILTLGLYSVFSPPSLKELQSATPFYDFKKVPFYVFPSH